ncbi:MAG: polysaccharide deacetylase family protein [Candidatus Omnitrophica bacterium]|nr:polysaccharide deacetylase family protein [Candidatus Omnitrophota bacterium]
MENTSEHPCFIASFHDLAPHSQDVCEEVLRSLKEWGVNRCSLLVVPKWHDGQTIDQHPDFLNWIRERRDEGHEISLHGCTHQAERVRGGLFSQAVGRIYTAGEGEFYQISAQDAQSRIRLGLKLLSDAGLPVRGFTPPAWLLSAEAREALAENHLLYTTEWNCVDLLQYNRKIIAPTLVYSSRSAWRRWTSIRWVKIWERFNRGKPVIRLAIHPIDWSFAAVRESIRTVVIHLKKTRTPMTYLELAQSNERRHP